jgi:hypothetical protein
MSKESAYSKLLRDPRWQKKRLELFEDYGWRCAKCSSEEKTLNVHHWYYDNALTPWDYPNKALCVLCEDCHAEMHEIGHKNFWKHVVNKLDREFSPLSLFLLTSDDEIDDNENLVVNDRPIIEFVHANLSYRLPQDTLEFIAEEAQRALRIKKRVEAEKGGAQ